MEDITSVTDAELVKKSLENPDYFRYVIERYNEKLARYIRRRSHATSHDVDDILQDVFIKIYRNLNDYDEKLTFSSWVYRITHNHIIDWYRKEKKHDVLELDGEENGLVNFIASTDSAEAGSHLEELSLEINQALSGLDDSYREVVMLRFFEDKSYDEISDIMQIPVSLVGARLSRAKTMIKKKLLANSKK